MPRGVYDRSKIKKKTEAAAPVAAKPAAKPVAKVAKPVAKVKAVKAAKLEKSELYNAEPNRAIPEDKPVVSQLAFSILGANLSTLSDAYEKLGNAPELSNVVAVELISTVKAMGALREAVFGSTKAEVAAEAPATEEVVEESAPVDVKTEETAPVAAAGTVTLPQPPAVPPPSLHGNASPFQIPAPPHLPGH